MEIERLGPYRIVGTLGRGGMGVVYEAVHSETGEAAAVKLLLADLAETGPFRGRFEAEIETLRKLNHPNIVRLIGFGEQDEHLFYAMELVDGNSLEEELRRGRHFGWEEVLQIGIETCHALRHAHDRGIIHRDLKPGNLLLTKDGKIKLSDFGIARLFGSTGMTSAGSVLGTAEYMAPEQAEGRPVDARADLYSLGGVMYVLLARRPMFRGKSLPEILHKQRHEQPAPIRSFAPDTPEAFERILNQLLQKDPRDRFPNINVLTRRLEALREAAKTGLETIEAEGDWFATNYPGAKPTPPSSKPSVASDASLPQKPSTPGGITAHPGQITCDSNSETQMVPSSGVDLPLGQPSSASGPLSDETTMAVTGDARPSTLRKPAEPVGHFTTVAEEDLDPQEEEAKRPVFSWQTGVLVFALLCVGGTIWWFLQPPTADQLYGKINAHMPEGWNDSVVSSEHTTLEPLIQDFLNRFSDDNRAPRLRSYQKDIELYHLQRKFNLRINGLAGAESLSPVEQAYMEAVSYLNLEPEVGESRLQAIVDLYGRKSDTSSTTSQCVELVRRRLARMREEIKETSAEQFVFLKERLDAADAMRANDPQTARAIYQAIVRLYANKPWAAPYVERAANALKQAEAAPLEESPKLDAAQPNGTSESNDTIAPNDTNLQGDTMKPNDLPKPSDSTAQEAVSTESSTQTPIEEKKD